MATPPKIFVSYSHKDKVWLERLQEQFAPLARGALLDPWDDTQIAPGTQWREEIARAIDEADIAVLHFWPFDGWDIPEGRCVLAEVYPSIFRDRYPREGRTAHQHDAYSVARWLSGADRRGLLGRFARPPLTGEERRMAALEGWILGVV